MEKWFKNTILGLTALTTATPAFSAEKNKEKVETGNAVVSEAKVENTQAMKSVEAMEQEKQAYIEKAKQEIEEFTKEVKDQENILSAKKAEREMYFNDFAKHVAHAAEYLGKREGKKFATVGGLPQIIESRMIAASKSGKFAKADFTSPEAVQHFKDEFLNYEDPETGGLIQIMSSVSNENNLGSPRAVAETFKGHVNDGLGVKGVELKGTSSDAVKDNHFFNEAIGRIIRLEGRVIMEARKDGAMKKQLSQLEQNLNDYLLANYLIPPEMANK